MQLDKEKEKGYIKPLEHAEDLDPLLEKIGDSKYVLLGEASCFLKKVPTCTKNYRTG